MNDVLSFSMVSESAAKELSNLLEETSTRELLSRLISSIPAGQCKAIWEAIPGASGIVNRATEAMLVLICAGTENVAKLSSFLSSMSFDRVNRLLEQVELNFRFILLVSLFDFFSLFIYLFASLQK